MTRAGFLFAVAAATLFLRPQDGGSDAPAPSAHSTDAARQQALADRIDAALASAWKSAGITPAAPATDATWLRRASIDLRGRPPTAEEVEAFLADSDPGKRGGFVDRCLADPGFAENLSCIWVTLLLSSSGKDARKVDDWLQPWFEEQLLHHTPFAEITRKLIADADNTDEPGSIAFILGYRDAIDVLTAVTARAFLGLQIQCAQCHDHPFDRWKPADFNHLAGFFVDMRAGHSPGGRHLHPIMYVDDRNVDDDVRARMQFFSRQAQDPQAGERDAPVAMSAEMAPARPNRLEVDGGAEMESSDPVEPPATTQETRIAEAAALDEVVRLFRSAPKGENPLRAFDAAPEKLTDLMTRLPADARDELQKYKDRRDLYYEARVLDGAPYQPVKGVTRRQALADWIVSPENPWFGRAIANRCFSQLFGKGLVEPIDDLSGSKDRVLPELLDLLADEFLQHDTDLRHLMGAFARTKAYGLANSRDPDAAERDRAERLFAAHPVRTFTAVQALRALLLALGAPAADGAGDSESARLMDKGSTLEKLAPYFVPDPGSGDGSSASIPQSLFLMNSQFVNTLTPARRAALLAPFLDPTLAPAARLRRIFLATLQRPPTDAEAAALSPLVDAATGGAAKGVENLTWALLNSTEFHTNH